MTHLLYVDDLKVFASSESKLSRVLRSTSAGMQDRLILISVFQNGVTHYDSYKSNSLQREEPHALTTNTNKG